MSTDSGVLGVTLSPADAHAHAEVSHAIDAAIDFLGGVAGGTASVYVGQPLDTVKVKLQTFPALYRSATHCFMRTLREEGISRGLYAGTIPSLAAQVSENAVLFVAYGFCQKAVAMATGRSDATQLSPVLNASAGGLAAFWSSLVLCPTELIKCRLQTAAQCNITGRTLAGSQMSAMQITRGVLATEGVRGMFRGLVPTIAREMPGYFFFFGGYEASRALLTPPNCTKDEIGVFRTMVSGAVGGVSLWAAVFPADVIKSRAQVLTTNQQEGFFKTMATIARQEGVHALYQGLGATLLRTIPATACLFLAYETTKSSLSRLYAYNANS